MLNFLIDKFIKSRNFNDVKNREKLVVLTGVMGLSINLLIFLLKIIIGFMSNSVAIISDAINNLSDSMSSLVTIVGTKIAAKPADKEHPYGHGRTEYIASLIVGIFIILVGFELLKTSIKNIFNPKVLEISIYMAVILVISILLKLYMYFYNVKAYKMSGSTLNKMVSVDSMNDVLATSLVLISVIVGKNFNINIDPYVGIVISIVVLKSGIEIFLEIGNKLMGKEIPQETIEAMTEIILEGKYIKGVHQIEIHEYGRRKLYGSCHVEVPANIDTYTMHKILHQVEMKVYKEMEITLSIHADPNYLLEKDEFNKVDAKYLIEDVDSWHYEDED
ncbi:cation diffusion facilitator family transporter [Helcococcus sueciensis]|uniref:cation diffusion facilitator family transporter n=1 Tax=Helcococcus sueciensis TaxID=241555 RepID=UPI000410CDF7|nr:cation diffusion facilitator family transporter [Helcococcus sueciensis]